MRARELTSRGVARARQFLSELRENPNGRKSPPRDLLRGPEYTRPFGGDLSVDFRWHPFASRREIGEYLAPKLRPFRAWIGGRTSFWSWLGMYHFEETVRIVDGAVQLSPLDEMFVLDPLDEQNLRGIHRHCLRAAWQVYEIYGEKAAFLLDQPPTARGDIADRIFQSQRIFNSVGIVPLILGLYTDGTRPKRGFQGRPGGLRHLLRVLDQLERTHDIYGMSPEALVRVLPTEFDPWVNGAPLRGDAPAADDSEKQRGVRASARVHDRKRSPEDDGSADPGEEDTRDLKLQRWEQEVRRNGRGTMRYKGFQANVRIEATGSLHGNVVNADGRQIELVTADTAVEFKRRMKHTVDEFIQDQIEIANVPPVAATQRPGQEQREPASRRSQPAASRDGEPPLTESQQLYLDFWRAFQRLAEATSDGLQPRPPQPTPYTGYPIGRSGFKLVAVASLWDSKHRTYDSNELRVELAVEGRDGHSNFNALKERREEIERELTFRLVWSKKEPSVKRCRIYVRRTVDLNDRGAWPGYHAWLLAHLRALDRVFRPRIEGL